MPEFMRAIALLITVLMFWPGAANASDDDFSGAWMAWICPAGAKVASGTCDNFVLELFQHQNQLCGTHVFATAGAGNMDEGAAPSLTGTVQDGVARITVESGAPSPQPTQVTGELKLANKKTLLWVRQENPSGHLLPAKARLTRSQHGSLLAPFFAQKLQAVCALTALPAAAQPEPATSLASPGKSSAGSSVR